LATRKENGLNLGSKPNHWGFEHPGVGGKKVETSLRRSVNYSTTKGRRKANKTVKKLGHPEAAKRLLEGIKLIAQP